jgi:uncharacterized protein
MDSADFFAVTLQHNLRLPMRDSISLSANLWLPTPKTDTDKFPAILEMIPYRKDDWRYASDHQHGQYFAERGFAFCRLDVRGTGSSKGIAYDEYTTAETQDGYDVVEWLAAQGWCNGKVGMWGISYGGFTSIQVAMRQPPHLKAIIPMYATDDRYRDDVHYVGGCVTVSDLSQYAVSMVACNAMPAKIEYARDWAAEWKQRLEETPCWLIEWLKHQTDGPYWRNGSLAPNYDQLKCAVFNIGGWMDSYVDPSLRMQALCNNAPSKTIVGNWVHDYPAWGTPGPNLDHLDEMTRFFARWLKDEENGFMDGPLFTFFRREYTPPEPFPAKFNGQWMGLADYKAETTQPKEFFLGEGSLGLEPAKVEASDLYQHQPTHGFRAGSLCWGAGAAPNGLARDLRPDEATIPCYTSAPLTEPLDILGMPEAVLYLSCTAPVAHAVVRLSDVAPDGTSSQVTAGILNLTHRESHVSPQPLTPGTVYEVRVPMRAAGYRFLPGHRIRLSVASAWWPVIFPSPYEATNTLYHGPAYASRLVLPTPTPGNDQAPPAFKTTPPELISIGGGSEDAPKWEVVEDVIAQTVTVKIYEGSVTTVPDGSSMFASERIELTAHHTDPLQARLYNTVTYRYVVQGYEIEIISTGTTRTTRDHFHIDVQLQVKLNGGDFFAKSWLESVPRVLN